ncbi:hypothetical protein [Coleofasciculus sp. FACHB-SPT9]|uniref:hypothetical protein n=1 Tax=Cyanophyceae TaxID=3028117 RepID=UPI001682E456|nr:hypothetical protein [Coleofasciculus sp. FACHB-SPT9]MBD1887956.1 hypothetical protein [Coleofasciculus sp. FACHB-SPT9]
MNPKLAMLGAFAVGIVGSSVATAGHFDGKIEYCHPTATGCEPRTVPDWIQVNQSASQVKRTPGAAGWKLCGALVAVAGFGASMSLARSLSCIESKHQKYQGIWDGLNLQKLKLQAQAELESFNQQTMIQAAEQSYAVLAPYQEPMEAEVVSEAITPDTQAAPIPQPVQPQQPSPREKLIKLIQEHEGGWIEQLMKKPILIYGDMGSFKSYFAAFLALVRYYLHCHKIVGIADPHFHQNKTDAWKYLVKLAVVGYGSNHNYAQVGEALEAMYERFSTRTLKDQWITSIWDEVTNYNQYDECKEPASLFIRKVLTDPRKAAEAPILIAHDNTLQALGGGEGISKAKNRGLIQIELYSDSDNKPLFRGRISGIKTANGETIEGQEITIKPEWIRPEYVWKLFQPQKENVPGSENVQQQNENVPEPSQNPGEPNDVERLERLMNVGSSNPEPTEPAQIADPLNPDIEPWVRGSVVAFRRSGIAKDVIIERVWGVKKGGSEKYKAAKERLEQILNEAELT